MFNDRYGLTAAVLEGRKTMTRRVEKGISRADVVDISEWGIDDKGRAHVIVTYTDGSRKDVYPKYTPGEVVAVAQRYTDVIYTGGLPHPLVAKPGWTNKMFVRANIMPHQIRITNVRVERLCDISDEDAQREGVYKREELHPRQEWEPEYTFGNGKYHAKTPIVAFASLIDSISKWMWEDNPYVFVYDFELVK